MGNANDVLISRSSKKSGQGTNAELGRECDDNISSDCRKSILYTFLEVLGCYKIITDITGVLIIPHTAFVQYVSNCY